MSFTDEDLKRLKEIAEIDQRPSKVSETTLDNEFLRALVARLEAAEKAARWFNVITVEDQKSEPYQDYLAWRKAAGK
jgi:hypothetical protein